MAVAMNGGPCSGWGRYKCGSIVRGLSRRIKTMEAKMDFLTSGIPGEEFVEVRM